MDHPSKAKALDKLDAYILASSSLSPSLPMTQLPPRLSLEKPEFQLYLKEKKKSFKSKKKK